MEKKYLKIEGDLLIDSNGNIIEDYRYDPNTGQLVKPSGLNTYYIDENGIKHIAKLSNAWQELTCDFNDILVRVGSVWKVITKLEYIKQKKIEELKEYAYSYITSVYPEWKQSNDVRDFQTIITELRGLYNVTLDEIYADVYSLKGASTVEEILIKYGIRNGYILTNSLGQELYNFYLNDGTVVQANKNMQVIDDTGNVISTIDPTTIINSELAYSTTAPIEEIQNAINLTNKLKDILNRMTWLDAIRNAIDTIENEINAIQDPVVVENYDYKSKLERFKFI